MSKLGRKAVAGLALAAVPVLALAAPAAADAQNSDSETIPFTFKLHGQNMSCTLEVQVRYLWDEETDTTRMDGYTRWYNPVDPQKNAECRDTIVIGSVSVKYKEGGEQNSFFADGQARTVAASSTVHGRASNLEAEHRLTYICDIAQGQVGTCDDGITHTSAK
jgi:hypothetical protein